MLITVIGEMAPGGAPCSRQPLMRAQPWGGHAAMGWGGCYSPMLERVGGSQSHGVGWGVWVTGSTRVELRGQPGATWSYPVHGHRILRSPPVAGPMKPIRGQCTPGSPFMASLPHRAWPCLAQPRGPFLWRACPGGPVHGLLTRGPSAAASPPGCSAWPGSAPGSVAGCSRSPWTCRRAPGTCPAAPARAAPGGQGEVRQVNPLPPSLPLRLPQT